MKYSIEIMREVWDDASGDHIEVGPDRDGLGMVELRYGKDGQRMSFPPEMAYLIARAITACADEVTDKSDQI